MVLPGKGMGWMAFFKAVKNEYQRDKVGDTAGALTFFLVLALFPFLLFLVSLASVIIDPAQAQGLIDELSKVAPQDVTNILSERIQSLAQGSNVGLLTVGGLGAIWAASGGIVALMKALNTAYDVRESRPFWKVRGLALLMTVVTALIALVAALAAVVTPALANAVGEPWGTLIMWLRLPVAGLLMMLVWALLYWALPDVEQKFKFISPGSIAGVVIWVLASWGFSAYVRNFGKFDVNYGAIGGVIVMLLWLWISSQVLLLGAEINAILEHQSPEGKSPGGKKVDEGGPSMTKGERRERERPAAPVAPRPSPQHAVALRVSPLGAALKWASGLGLGVVLLRRGSSR